MSAEEQARFTVQSLLSRGLGATEVARRTGLAGASEVWGGDEPLDRPAWYVWLAGSPGAYRLGLEEAGAATREAWRARFTIRYYPSPGEEVFQRFSAAERDCVEGGFLDATGTPRIEVASRIPETFFVVGSMEWASHGDGEATVVGLSTLDRLRTRDETGRDLRDVPGWRLSAGLVTTLTGLHAQIGRCAVRRIVLSRQPGFEFVDAGSESACRDSAETVHAEAALLFGRPGEIAVAGTSLLAMMRDPECEVVADERFDGACRHPQALEADARLALPVSHAWFGGEVVPEDRIACAC